MPTHTRPLMLTQGLRHCLANNPVLVALAQNGALRLRCDRATISLLDDLRLSVIAEATPRRRRSDFKSMRYTGNMIQHHDQSPSSATPLATSPSPLTTLLPIPPVLLSETSAPSTNPKTAAIRSLHLT
ncbi:unnamed protein product [Aureobasidium pullulans]|nr:unnamed protein product [Aureobasidium pullulans]